MDNLHELNLGLTGVKGYSGDTTHVYFQLAQIAEDIVKIANEVRDTMHANEGAWDDDGFSN